MNLTCPDKLNLLLFAVGADTATNTSAFAHLQDCASCQRHVAQLWETVDALRSDPVRAAERAGCLDDVQLAGLADAFEPNAQTHGAASAHLAQCAHCRTQLAALVSLLEDPALAAEQSRLEPYSPLRKSRFLPAGLTAGAAVAILALVLLRPEPALQLRSAPEPGADPRRDGVVTMSGAPRIIAPTGALSAHDSLQWTSVAHADLYRITIWDLGGVVIWEGQVRDTVLALPPALTGPQDMTYMWVVDARTGIDRWVSSPDLQEFTVRANRTGRQ